MIEPITLLATYGLTATAKFIYQSVLQELNKDSTKAWVKDVLQDWLKDVAKDKLSGMSGSVWDKAIKFFGRDSLDVAAETAIAAFLLAIIDHLADDLNLSEEKQKRYQKPLNQFLKEPSVRQILGKPFKQDCDFLDNKALKETWEDLGLRDLPDDFDWHKIGNEYLKTVRKIFHESPELKPLLDFQRQEQDSKNLQALAGIVPNFNLQKLQETILEKYGNLKLESLDSSGYIYDKELKIYQIFIPQQVKECQEYLPQVYELPKELQRKLQEQGELEREITSEELERYQRAYSSQQINSVLNVINDHKYKYLVILGDPGSGKSTLLQYLAVKWATLPIKELPSHPITLLIELQKYIQDFTNNNGCNNFLDFIHQGSNWVCHLDRIALDKKLQKGEVRILFDGLDEVFDPQLRETVITQIHNFTQTYDKVKVVLTSRIIGYKPRQLKDAEFHHFMLQDLNATQIEDFLKKWHDLTYNEAIESQKKQDRKQRIGKAIKESSAIQQLAGNPLLLTMMAILNRNQDLPRDRAKLYERSSELLLYQWDVEGKLLEHPELKNVDIDYTDKQAMLRDIAHFMQATEKGLTGNLISQKDLEAVIIKYLKTIDVIQPRKVARLMIDQLRTRNFILCDVGSNYYAFVHRTFLEYFCAWSYIWQFKETQTVLIEDMKTEVYGKHWRDESWHEVLRLIAGMLEPKFVGEIIEYLTKQDGESVESSDLYFSNLFLAADCLAELNNYLSIKNISELLRQKIQELLSTVCYLQHTYVLKIKIIHCIAEVWRTYPETLPLIKQLAQSNDVFVGMVAIQELAQGWREHPETLPLIKQIVQSNDIEYIRSTAVQELARGWRKHPETLPLIKQIAQSDDRGNVKNTAIKELAQGWHDDREIYNILYDCAIKEPFIRVTQKHFDWGNNRRLTALEAITKYFPQHPQTKDLLQDRVKNDPDEEVREFAQQALAEIY